MCSNPIPILSHSCPIQASSNLPICRFASLHQSLSFPCQAPPQRPEVPSRHFLTSRFSTASFANGAFLPGLAPERAMERAGGRFGAGTWPWCDVGLVIAGSAIGKKRTASQLASNQARKLAASKVGLITLRTSQLTNSAKPLRRDAPLT